MTFTLVVADREIGTFPDQAAAEEAFVRHAWAEIEAGRCPYCTGELQVDRHDIVTFGGEWVRTITGPGLCVPCCWEWQTGPGYWISAARPAGWRPPPPRPPAPPAPKPGEHVHTFVETGRPCIPNHGMLVCCAGCRQVCACGMASCGVREDEH